MRLDEVRGSFLGETKGLEDDCRDGGVMEGSCSMLEGRGSS